ncbi:MAG: PQQ-binding-like beta-propeller repeat protein [Candidatus Micrarchaeota archaeon]|nr:PQQ-binding-like beta-propeller repeat protein [Candidatus Micrarchaeota archaeon]
MVFAFACCPSWGRIIWSASATDAIIGAPVVFGSKAIYASYDGWVYAVSADSGTVLWTFNAKEKIEIEPQPIDSSVVAVVAGDELLFLNSASGLLSGKASLKSKPLWLGGGEGRAFVAFNGTVEAYDKDGRLAWREEVGGLPGAIGYGRGFVSLTAGGKLYSLSAKNGARRWEPVEAEDSFTSRPVEYDGSIYFGASDGKVYAVDAASGRIRWTYQTGGWAAGSPAISSSSIYIGSLDGTLYALSTSGSLRWKFPTGGAIHTKPELYSSAGSLVAVFGSEDGKVYGVETASGSEKWSYSANGKPSSAVYYKDYFIFSTSRGRIYALSPSPICSFSVPKSGDVVGNWLVDFEGSASSEYAMRSVEVRLEGAGWVRANGTERWHAVLDMRQAQEGAVNIQCRASDESGKAETDDYSFITLIKSESAPLRKMFIVAPPQVGQNESFILSVQDEYGRQLRGVLLKLDADEVKGDSPFSVVLGKSGLVKIGAEKDGFESSPITVRATGGSEIVVVAVFLLLVLAAAFYFFGWKRLKGLVEKK